MIIIENEEADWMDELYNDPEIKQILEQDRDAWIREMDQHYETIGSETED